MKIRKRLPKMSVESPQEQVGVGGGALLIASAVAATRSEIGGGDDGAGQPVRHVFHLNEQSEGVEE